MAKALFDHAVDLEKRILELQADKGRLLDENEELHNTIIDNNEEIQELKTKLEEIEHNKNTVTYLSNCTDEIARKIISDLQKENTELKEPVSFERDLNEGNHKAFMKQLDEWVTKNFSLKEENEKLNYKLSEISKRFEPQDFVELMDEVEQEFNRKQNLTKAMEIITSLLNCFPYDMPEEELDSGQVNLIEKAEQFLKDCEVENDRSNINI